MNRIEHLFTVSSLVAQSAAADASQGIIEGSLAVAEDEGFELGEDEKRACLEGLLHGLRLGQLSAKVGFGIATHEEEAELAAALKQ